MAISIIQEFGSTHLDLEVRALPTCPRPPAVPHAENGTRLRWARGGPNVVGWCQSAREAASLSAVLAEHGSSSLDVVRGA